MLPPWETERSPYEKFSTHRWAGFTWTHSAAAENSANKSHSFASHLISWFPQHACTKNHLFASSFEDTKDKMHAPGLQGAFKTTHSIRTQIWNIEYAAKYMFDSNKEFKEDYRRDIPAGWEITEIFTENLRIINVGIFQNCDANMIGIPWQAKSVQRDKSKYAVSSYV